MTVKEHTPLLSLQAEFANLAFAVTIQDDDEIFKTVFDRSWTSDVVEIGNGTTYDHKGFRDYMMEFRKNVTDRKLVSHTFIAAPSDPEGKEGTVARVAHTTGIQDGQFVNFRSAAIATLVFDEKVGRRKIIRETFVVQTE